MKKAILLTMCLLLGIFSGTSFAVEVTTFGSKQYVRTSGAPDTYTDTFDANQGIGMLIVKNGQIDGKDRIIDAISSAKVFVNGVQIFGPSDFNKNVYLLESPIDLTETNSITVGLASQSESFLIIEVKQDILLPSADISADPESMMSGESITLTWNTTDAYSCIIEPEIGSVSVNGSISVSPIETTTYTIIATNRGGTASDSITVTVYQPPTVSLNAAPETIRLGETSALTWASTNADSATIDQGIGSVSVDGSTTIAPTETTTYTITVTGAGGTTTSGVTITVTHPVPTVEITASPDKISIGDPAALAWSATHADGCVIAPDVGQAPINGAVNVFPGQTTTYTITANGPGGSASAEVTVIVVFPPSMVVVEPDGVDDEPDTQFTIKWMDSDSNDNATISLYYDNDNSGADGTLIVSSLNEDPDGETDDVYVWDTTHIEEGEYYVYGVIDDGTNDPVVAYSEGPVYTVHGIPREIKLAPDDISAGDNFGGAVSISGDTSIVGAPHDDDAGESSGSAYIFKRKGAAWVEETKLTASDAAPEDYFGHSVSISGDYAFVGAHGNDDNGESSGSIYVFKRDGETWTEQAKIVPSDTVAYDYFGWSIAIDGNYTVVGAYGDDDLGSESGSAYVFKLDGTTWTEQAKLTASDGNAEDYFGHSVSLSKGSAIIGAYGDDDGGNESGAAYVFTLEGTIWNEDAKLTAYDADPEDYFGWSVSISGDCAIAGAYGDDDGGSNAGAVYVFKRNSPWYLDEKLTASDGASGDLLGYSISQYDTYAVIGAYGDDDGGTDSGSAYLLMFPPPGAVFVNKIIADDAEEGNLFGSAVAISGPYVIVGAIGHNAGGTDSGAAYVYPVCTANLGADPEIIRIGETSELAWDIKNAETIGIDPGIGSVSAFGSTFVAPGETTTYTILASGLSGTSTDSVTVHVIDPSVPPTVNISASRYIGAYATLTWNSTNAENCYIEPNIGSVDLIGSRHVSPSETTTYTIIATGPAGVVTAETTVVWEPMSSYENKILASDGTEIDQFGHFVSISGDYAIVGAPKNNPPGGTGAAYIFKRDGASWAELAKLTGSDGTWGDDFGYSVAISGDYAIVGAPKFNSGETGAVYIFKCDDAIWVEQVKLNSEDADAPTGDIFGRSVSISGDYAIVGGYGDIDGEYPVGAAYIFIRDGATWTKLAKLTPSDGGVYSFGDSVSINGDYAIVGHYSRGAAYIFTRDGETWTEQAKLTASDGTWRDDFGGSVSISGDYAIVGNRAHNDVMRYLSGAAYIFKRDGVTWTEQTKLIANDATAEFSFGYSVSINGDYALVGTQFHNDAVENSGAAYIFKRDGTIWSEMATLSAGKAAGDDPFSYSVAIDGDYALVGTTERISSFNILLGSAYIYYCPSSSVNITVDSAVITLGEPATLSWNSSNVDSLTIDQGVGDVSSSGTFVVSPDQTTTYTITGIGSDGATTDSVTVHVIDPNVPPTVVLTADPETIYPGVETTLTWSSTNATSCVLAPGFGDLGINGSLKVSPDVTTTYIISATGPAGNASAQATIKVSSLLPSNISYPDEGEVIYRPDALIRGQIVNMSGAETGVTVNGVVAMVYENEFVVNHVPLDEGTNTITVIATDSDGNTIETTTTVNAFSDENYVLLTAEEYEGISPFETKMTIEATFDISESELLMFGPGTVEVLDRPSNSEYVLRVSGEGIYYFSVDVTDKDNNTYEDKIGIVVLDEASLDALLKVKWNGMRSALRGWDIPKALRSISLSGKREMYEYNFNLLSSHLIEIEAGFQDIQKVEIKNGVAEYKMIAEQDGQMYSWYILFSKDSDGIWRIEFF